MAETVVKWETPGSVQTYLTTELNALANGGSVLGGAIDPGDALYINLELYVPAIGSARTAGGYVGVDLCASVDGTNYCNATVPCAQRLTQFPLDASIAARYVTRVNLPIPPTNFKLNITNTTGQSFPATGVTIKYTLHSEEIQ